MPSSPSLGSWVATGIVARVLQDTEIYVLTLCPDLVVLKQASSSHCDLCDLRKTCDEHLAEKIINNK